MANSRSGVWRERIETPFGCSILKASSRSYRPGSFFLPFPLLSGDYGERITNLSKARRLLGWQPLARPTRFRPRGAARAVLQRALRRWWVRELDA